MKFSLLALTAILISSQDSVLVEAAKKKKQKAANSKEKEDVKINDRFIGIEPELYCQSCTTIVGEAFKELRGFNTESNVYGIVADMCSHKRHRDNLYPVDRIKAGCETFLGDWEETLEQELINNYSDVDSFTNNFCFHISQACQDIDMSFQNKPKFSLDGIKQDPSMITMSDSPNAFDKDPVRRAERQRRFDEKETRERWEKERLGIVDPDPEDPQDSPAAYSLPEANENQGNNSKSDEERIPTQSKDPHYEEVVVDPNDPIIDDEEQQENVEQQQHQGENQQEQSNESVHQEREDMPVDPPVITQPQAPSSVKVDADGQVWMGDL